MPEEVKPVNLPVKIPDLVGTYKSAYTPGYTDYGGGIDGNAHTYSDVFNSLLNQGAPKTGQDFPVVAAKDVDFSGRYPLFYPGRDNEEMYAQSQGSLEKAYNGVAKMAGIATTTFINGTVGLIVGIGKSIADGKFSSFYDNDLSRSLNEFNEEWENKYAHYKTVRERNGNWWEPSNLFTGNFLWDNIVKNLGFSLGAAASGFAWGGALKAIGLTSKIIGAGAEMAAKADTAISEASALPQVDRLSAINSNLSNIWNNVKATTGKGLMNFDKGVVAVFGTAGEAGLESLNNSQEFRKNMIDEFTRIHGYAPTEQDLSEINTQAENVGKYSFLLNSALLTATNYIQLPKIYSSSFKAEKEVLNNIALKEGKYISTLPEKGFGKLLYKTRNISSLFFNTAEAFEEGAQYAIQTGTQNYFGRKYRKQEDSVLDDGILYGIKEAISSNEGLLNIFTGGFSGALQSSGVLGIKDGRPVIGKTGKIGERGLTGYGGEEGRFREEAINALNNSMIRDKMKDAYSNLKASESIQKDREAAIRKGDILESKDLEFDYAHSFISTRLKYKAKEAITDEINSLREQASTDGGFLKLQQEGIVSETDTKQSFLTRLNNLEQHANHASKLQDALDLKYKGLIDPETNRRIYPDEVIDKLVYAGSKVMDYDRRIPQLNTSLLEVGINTLDILQSIIKNNTPNKEATVNALNQINDLDVTSDVKDDLKTSLSDIVELSLRRKMFIDEYNDIKENPSRYGEVEGFQFGETKEVPVKVAQKDEEKPEKKLEIGKEYSLKEPILKEDSKLALAPKITVISQTLGGELEVKLPSGKTTFMTPEEFKKYNISDTDNTSQEMADVLDASINTVLNEDKYNDVKKDFLADSKQIEEGKKLDKVKWINSLDNQQLIDDIEKEFNNRTEEIRIRKEEEEKLLKQLAKDKDILTKEQEEIEVTNGGVPTGDPETETTNEEKEGALKDPKTFFISGITESEVYNDPTQSKPHIKRSREFLNNIKNSPNRANMRVILVTPQQQETLGMKGLAQMAYGKDLNSPLSEIPGIADAQQALIAQVFVIQEGGRLFFSDKNGNKLTEVGAKDASGNPINVDLNEVIFQAMPRAKSENGEIITKDSEGKNKFRAGQEEEFKAYAEAWAKYRENLFKLPSQKVPVFEFTVSRGIPKKNTVNGVTEKNHVGNILVPNSKIATTRGLIVIPTTGAIAHNGQLLKFSNGRPLLQYGDTLQFLNNKKFSNKQANAIFQVIKSLSEGYISKRILDKRFTRFLKNIMFYSKNKGAENRFFINPETSEIIIGNKTFPITKIAENEKEIVDTLKNVFNNVNNEGLTKDFDNKFVEYYLDENNNLAEREWKNYQEYLLSSTYPDGKARSIDETPLNTNVAAPTEALPYSFEQKYATLEAVNLNVQFAPKQTPAPQATPKAAPSTVVAGIDFNGKTENTIKINDELGDAKFTATLDENGKPVITATSTEQIINAAKNPATVKKYIDALRRINLLDEAKSPEEQLMDFVSLNIAAQVTTKLKEAPKAEIKEETPKEEKKEEVKPTPKEDGATDGPSDNDLDLRAKAPGEEGRMTDEELALFKEWHANNVPLFPYEVLENIIKLHNGVKAWGVYENNIAKFVRGGLRGTEYHEIGHGIWKTLSPEEQQAILNEERSKSGTFKDRASGKTYSYSDPSVSDKILEERIWDDFSDYRLGKLPARSLGERVRRLFKMIMDFFKSFVTNPSLKEQLFKAIDTGKFKNVSPSERTKNDAAEYRKVGNLTQQETHEFIQDMTSRASRLLYKNAKQDIFEPGKITSPEIFSTIKEQYQNERYKGIPKTDYIGEENWPTLEKRVRESLRTLGINFDEQERVDINDANYNNRDYAPEPFSVDWKKNSTGPLKFTIATLIQMKALNQEGNLTIELPKPDISSVGGYKLANYSRSFATLLDKLSNTTSFTKFTDKLLSLAKFDPNYIQLFQKLGGKLSTEQFDLDNFTTSDWRLLIQAVQTFTKQKPEALVQYIKDNETYVAPANIYTATNELKRQWMDNMKLISKKPVKVIPSNVQGADRLRWILENDYKLIRLNNGVYKVDTAALKLFPVKDAKDMITMLSKIGIEFPIDVYNTLKTAEKNAFAKAVSSIVSYFGKEEDVMRITKETMGINGPLSTLAELVVKTTNPNIDSTYFNLEGERVNNYTNNNYPSVFENEFNEVGSLEELLTIRPELNDVFSKGSQVLMKGGKFFDENGVRTDAKLHVRYIQGTDDNGKGITTSRLGLGARSTQEINMNVNGNYYVLIPADGSTEWMMNLGNTIEFQDFESKRAFDRVYEIFNEYLMDDINLALDAENRAKIRNIGKKASELRFFKDILSEKVLSGLNNLIASEDVTEDQIKAYINKNQESINDSIKAYIEETVEQSKDLLKKNGQILQYDENKFSFPELENNFASKNDMNKNNMSEEELTRILNFLNTNYIINNIEMHKVLFGDPYQFAIKDKNGKIILDETKRIKSFLSPALTMFDHPIYNNRLNEDMNKVGEAALKEGDPGYHTFKPYANTVTFADDKVVGTLANIMKAYDDVNVADAASWIMDTTHREVMLKNGKWGNDAEAFHQWQMAYTRRELAKKGEWSYGNNSALEKADNQILIKPVPKYKLAIVKPIIRGVKFNSSTINLVLDKTSQMPIYYSMVEGTSLEKMYLQMMKSGVGYGIVESGRKVGAEELQSIYNENGLANENPFNNNIQVPWKAYSIQVETAFEAPKEQTRGSQLTKLSSVDLFENGEASDEAKKEYKKNTEILNQMTLNGYRELLNKLGVIDTGNGFVMPNGKAVSETLMHEMLRREMSENAIDTIQTDENDQFLIPFEASPSYIQIRNIMYAMVDKAIVSPKVNGGSYVQVPVTGFEKATKGRGLVRKVDGKWVKITRQQYDALDKDQKKSVALTDDTLKFYEDEDGKRYCEVMLPAWFRDKTIGRKLQNGEKLTEEEEAILTGIGFRIPTDATNKIELYKVKGFLPDYMGYTVVVPAEITTKAGSDFDIDKLNMYLKATYIDENGKLRLVKYMGSEEATKDFYSKMFDKRLERKKINKAELFEAAQIIANNLDDPKDLTSKYADLIDEMMLDFENDVTNLEDYLMKEMEKLGDQELQSTLKEKFVKSMYKKSLENEYYASLERMISLPENFKRIIFPTTDAGLPKVAERLDELTGYDESAIKNRVLNRTYMTSLRHAFLLGKKWIGIAAVNITGHSVFQKSKIYINPNVISELSAEDQKFIGDASVALDHNKVDIDGEERISMSGRMTADGKEYISDRLSGYATSFVDVAKDPYILKIIKSDLIVGTFMFLERIGAGKQAAMFLNQPIISEYLTMLDSFGGKSLFTKANIELIKQRFVTTADLIQSAKMDVSIDNLEGNIRSFAENKGLSKEKNAEQILIFDEFLKYAKMAEHNYNFTQAINYDTTKFRSGDALARKEWRSEMAKQKNIISSIDKVFETSFLGDLKTALSYSMDAMSAVFKLETAQMRSLVEDIIRPFGENKYVSNDKFEKIAIQAKSALLDYIIETKTEVGSRLKELLVDANTSVAERLMTLKDKYPNLQILKELAIDASDRPDGAKTVKLNANTKEAYDENLRIGYMRELRDFNDETNQFYKDLVLLSLSQGTYQSPVTFRNIVPIEDYSKIITPAMSALVSDESMQAFKDSFYKNNFKNDDIMPAMHPKFFMASEAPVGVQTTAFGDFYADIFQYFSSMFPNIEAFKIKSSDRRILLLNRKYNDFYMGNTHLKVPRVVTDRTTGESIDMLTGKTITKMDYAKMKAKGDLSLSDVFGYQRVNLPSGDPLVTYDKKGNEIYVYKLINLLGDGYRAIEHYTDDRTSVFQNGTIQIKNVIPDSDIIEYYGGKIEKKDIPSQSPTLRVDIPMSEENIKKLESGEKTVTVRTQKEADLINIPVGVAYKRLIGGKPYAVRNRGYLTVQEAGGKEAFLKAEAVKDESELQYDHAKEFARGERRLYVYDIKPLTETAPVQKSRLSVLEEKVKTQGLSPAEAKELNELRAAKPVEEVKPTEKSRADIEVPKYTVDKTLKNADGTIRYASTDGNNIRINPVTDADAFFNYFEGKIPGTTSAQKSKVLEELAKKGYSIDVIKSILNTNKLINTFLILHEQSHIDNNDKDVYWKNDKDLLTPDKIAIEVRATIDALEKIQPRTLEKVSPEVRYKDKEGRIRIEYPENIKGFAGTEMKSKDLIKASEIPDGDEIEIPKLNEDYDYIENLYGTMAAEAYSFFYTTTKEQLEFLKNNPEFAQNFVESYTNDEELSGLTIREYAQALLDKNEKLIDTAQMSLFDPNNDDLEGADQPNPCGM